MESYVRQVPASFLSGTGGRRHAEYVPLDDYDVPQSTPSISYREHQEPPISVERQETISLLSSSSDDSVIKKEDESSPEPTIRDPYVPFPELEGIEEQKNPLTVRAIFLGLIFGSLVNATALYSGTLQPWNVRSSIRALTHNLMQDSRLARLRAQV